MPEHFRVDTEQFAGGNCGLRYVHDPDNLPKIPGKNPGCFLTFARPFESEEGKYEAVTVETDKGPIHLQFDLKYDTSKEFFLEKFPDGPIRRYHERDGYFHAKGEIVKEGIFHDASYGNRSDLKIGEILILCLPTHDESDEWNEVYKATYRRNLENIEKLNGFKCLYKSPKFFNWVHSEREYPCLTLFVLEKL